MPSDNKVAKPMLIDQRHKFICAHEFVAFPFGFVCHKCEHQRSELELQGDKRLLFFPARHPDSESLTAKQAYLQASK
jgi:hypothetical protein